MDEVARRWGIIDTRFGRFAAWVDGGGRLVRLRLDADDPASIDSGATHDEDAIAHVRRQVLEYCDGRRRAFDVERAAQGTPFQHQVWEALLGIPYGETCSYAHIARLVGRPAAARAVGRANALNPIALIVPCHRVIGANGTLTGYGGGLPLKQALLAHEASVADRRQHDRMALSRGVGAGAERVACCSSAARPRVDPAMALRGHLPRKNGVQR